MSVLKSLAFHMDEMDTFLSVSAGDDGVVMTFSHPTLSPWLLFIDLYSILPFLLLLINKSFFPSVPSSSFELEYAVAVEDDIVCSHTYICF